MPGSHKSQLDLDIWSGAEQYRFFRRFERPHYAVTSRIDVSHLMARKTDLPIFRSCIWAIGAGINAVPELRLRFEGEHVYAYDKIDLSATVATENGDFRFTYFTWQNNLLAFDAHVKEEIEKVRADMPHNPSQNRLDLAFLSCLPWMDFTSLDNAMPNADDCIPRVSWGKIVPKAGGFDMAQFDMAQFDMAMTLQVHHALALGAHVGQFFAATQAAFDAFATADTA